VLANFVISFFVLQKVENEKQNENYGPKCFAQTGYGWAKKSAESSQQQS
jgi:hypothetical protein